MDGWQLSGLLVHIRRLQLGSKCIDCSGFPFVRYVKMLATDFTSSLTSIHFTGIPRTGSTADQIIIPDFTFGYYAFGTNGEHIHDVGFCGFRNEFTPGFLSTRHRQRSTDRWAGRWAARNSEGRLTEDSNGAR